MARPRARRTGAASPTPGPLPRLNPNAAGLDVGASGHFVAVPADRDPEPVREFGAFTADLYRLADWLGACGIETVALESTGVYWIPVFQVLEARGFEVKLVDTHQLKRVPGRKTDVVDCQWLQQLHSFGLLAGAFRPDQQVCVLRSYTRQRAMLVSYAGQHVQHLQKALVQMNLQLALVLDDKAVELIEAYQAKIAACDARIQAHLLTFADRSDGQSPPKGPAPRADRHDLSFDATAELFRLTGVDLTAIKGLQAHTVLKVLSETGLDMTKWPTAKHFGSWLGLAPNHRVSGGKVLSRRTTPTANRAAAALRVAAQSLHHSSSALGAFLRRKATHRGMPKAITATAYKLATILYTMLTKGTEFVDLGQDYYERAYQDRVLKALTRRARAFGYNLVKQDQTAFCPASG